MKQAGSVLSGLYRNAGVEPVLNWANYLFAEHSSDSSTNYNSFLNFLFAEHGSDSSTNYTSFLTGL